MTTYTLDNRAPQRVGKLVCLARNYAEHIKELGNATPSAPVLFIKPSTSIIASGGQIVIPSYSEQCHHEIELAVLIGKSGRNIDESEAMSYVAGYGVALDMTLRDTQADLKEKGLPWEIAKGFDTSCPLGSFVPAAQVPDPHNLQLTLTVNDEVRQDDSSALMMRRIPEVIAYASHIFTLEEGDILLTGTPAGVARVVSGDRLVARIEGLPTLEVTVA
ncbi:MAG: acylpyruvase [Desulfuromonas sp.]|nr:MAG: acylpyruvase [Desulfuromonas sp.]